METSTTLTDDQVERWRILREEMAADAKWTAMHEQRDVRRLVVQKEMLELLNRFLTGQVETEELRETYDRKTRTDWDVFGLKGMSGAMFLNKLVKHIPDVQALAGQLQATLRVPTDTPQGRGRMRAFLRFLEDAIRSGQATKSNLQPARTPFFVSSWWHLQEIEAWPISYISGRRALEAGGLFKPTRDSVADYFVFRDLFLALAAGIGLKSWELEHLFSWQQERKVNPPPIVKPPITVPPVIPPDDETEVDLSHTQIQWLLAKIGKKLGCRVWIAANDQSKEWQGEQLGNLCIQRLPGLGMDAASERIVSLIDVLWIQGRKQVAAAFEIEHTTSIYSGLLRMSDLAALSPNLNFPLYIVAPESRLAKVRRELSRPTFQALELHKRCGFFSFEVLNREAEAMIRWASDPSAIDRLAESVDDVSD
jgi:hypothetical protein